MIYSQCSQLYLIRRFKEEQLITIIGLSALMILNIWKNLVSPGNIPTMQIFGFLNYPVQSLHINPIKDEKPLLFII